MIDIKQLYWAAGLIEGEGCFVNDCAKGSNYFRIVVVMTDKDIIDRLKSIFNFGKIREKKKQQEYHKTQFIWEVSKQIEVIGLMMTLLPLMGERRKDKIKKIFRNLEEKTA